VLWVYDVTALTRHELQVVEQERQLREILDYCPAVVPENFIRADSRHEAESAHHST
jgi:hypothetical protein